MAGVLGTAYNGAGYSGWVRIPGGVPVPLNALADYQYDQTNLVEAITELVNRQSVLLTVRASDVNVEQLDGSVRTFGPGEAAFVIAVGVLIQGRETNLHPNSSDLTVWDKTVSGTGTAAVVTPGFAIAPDGTTTATRVQMSLNGGTTSSDFTRLAESIPGLLANTDYTQSIWVKSNDANDYMIGALIANQSSSDNYTAGQQWSRMSKLSNTTTVGSGNGIQLRGTFGQSDTVDILIWAKPNQAGFQLEQSAFVSSFIYTNGAPATRLADNSTITTLLEKGLLLDENGNGGVVCTLGDLISGDFVHGVNPVLNRLSFFHATDPGKYSTLVSVLSKGAILTVGDTIARVTAGIPTNDFDVEILKGDINDFQWPAEFTIDFSTSDYFTDQAQLAIDRAAAGDFDLASLPAVEGWPNTDFRLTIPFEFRGFTEDFARLIANTLDGSNRTTVEYSLGSLTWSINTLKSAVFEGAASVPDLVEPPFGTNVEVVVEVNSTLGARIDSGNGFGSYNANMTSVNWDVSVSRLCRGQVSDRGLNGIVQTILLEPLT